MKGLIFIICLLLLWVCTDIYQNIKKIDAKVELLLHKIDKIDQSNCIGQNEKIRV